MDIQTYPGQGLSLSQLVFALNEELKRVAYSPALTFDAVSQLDHDASNALVTIREWRNSFVPINRLPSEVLSLIPTHFPHEKELLRVSSVCRHWRRTFIHHATLWSRLTLTAKRSDLFVKTFLERAKGSVLDIRSTRLDSADVFALLSPHAQRFRSLDFFNDHQLAIQRFSDAVSGYLPLLHTLKISVVGLDAPGPETANPPLLPLFSGAVNLNELIFHSDGELFLNYFVFPNLTIFEFSTMTENEEFPTSHLLDFLEASPTLRTVRIEIRAQINMGDVPLERVIVLPNVETFAITEDEPGYEITTHISCPSARHISLIYDQYPGYSQLREALPTSGSWNAIAAQYTADPIDEVVFGITSAWDLILSCSLSFFSPGHSILQLGYKVTPMRKVNDETAISLGMKHSVVFFQACIAIRDYPRLKDVKRLRIRDRHPSLISSQLTKIAEGAALLFKSAGPLEELTLDVIDLRPYLAPFLDLPEFQDTRQLGAFPAIKELTIAEQSGEPLKEECAAAIVEFARSQYTLGVPFEHVIFRMGDSPLEMAGRLEPWVGTVHFDEMIMEDLDPM